MMSSNEVSWGRSIVAAYLLTAFTLVWAVSGCEGDRHPTVCEPGATQTCVCPNLQKGAQSCNASGSGWDGCVCVSDQPPSGEKRPPVTHERPSTHVRNECDGINRQTAGDSDLVAMYSFDGHVCDVSPNRLDGTRTEAVRFVEDRLGVPGAAVEFTHRANARIDFGKARPIADLGNRFTISFWVKVNGENGGIIINHDQIGTYTNDWTIGVHGAGELAGRPYLTFGNPAATATKRVNDGRWHHVVIRRERTGSALDFFVDGQHTDYILDPRLQNGGLARDLTSQCGTNLGPYRMPGRWADNGFIGSLDDLQFYRRALSDIEIVRLVGDGSQQRSQE